MEIVCSHDKKNKYAVVASESLFIGEYFPRKSRSTAIEMAKIIIDDFWDTMKSSDWTKTRRQKA